MTKVRVDPGPCGFKALIFAETEDGDDTKVRVNCGCKAIQGMMEQLGDTLSAYEVCLVKPGCGPLFEYASQYFPVHASCPVISAITKCMEVECGLALRHDVAITFEEAK